MNHQIRWVSNQVLKQQVIEVVWDLNSQWVSDLKIAKSHLQWILKMIKNQNRSFLTVLLMTTNQIKADKANANHKRDQNSQINHLQSKRSQLGTKKLVWKVGVLRDAKNVKETYQVLCRIHLHHQERKEIRLNKTMKILLLKQTVH